MKRFSLILGVICAVVGSGNAFATTPAMPTTLCPTNITCAFDAAEVRPLTDATPGAPGVFIGYLSFNNSGQPTLDVTGTTNGNVQNSTTFPGTCAASTSTAFGILDFSGSGGQKFTFVSDNNGGELRVMVIADANGVTPSAVNLATCTQ
jgi:hypothetical protein